MNREEAFHQMVYICWCLEYQPPEQSEANVYCLSHLVYGSLLQQPE